MLNTLTIEHIRMFNEKPWQFNFAPLTVLCGTNGSGKTTLLKTLLLLKQSQEAAKSRRQYQGYLRFTGDHVDLGNYDSFVSFNKIEDDIAIALRYTDMMPKEIYIGLSNYANVDSKDIDDDWVEYDLEVKLIFKRSFGQSEVSKQKKKSKVCNEYKHISGILHKSFYTIYFKDKAILDWHLIGVEDGNEALNTREYSIHLPNKFFESVGGNKLFLTDNADEAEYLSLKVMLDGLFPNTLLAVWKDDKDSDSNTKGKYPLPPAINIVINNLMVPRCFKWVIRS